MARRRRPRGGRGGWWTVALLVIAAVMAWWYFGARRAEAPAPPSSVPGARVIGEPPAREEITPEEKAELGRILRERAATSPVPRP